MKLITVFLFLILSLSPAFCQPSSAPSSGSMICFTESELEAMEAEAARIMEDAVVEAVNAAVEPYRITVLEMNAELDEKNRAIMFWKITTGVSAGVLAVVSVLFVISRFIPQVP